MFLSAALFESWGLSRTQFEGETIIDVGSGSRMRGRYFHGTRLISVEPMAAALMEKLEQEKNAPMLREQNGEPVDLSHIDLFTHTHSVFAQPAEVRVCAVERQARLVFSINALDHGYNFQAIIANLGHLLLPCPSAALLIISVDLHNGQEEGYVSCFLFFSFPFHLLLLFSFLFCSFLSFPQLFSFLFFSFSNLLLFFSFSFFFSFLSSFLSSLSSSN